MLFKILMNIVINQLKSKFSCIAITNQVKKQKIFSYI